MRDQGYDLPDPEVDEWGRTQVDAHDDEIEQALPECIDGSGPGGPS